MSYTPLTIETLVSAPVTKAWEVYTQPEYITQWNFASDDWQCPSAQSDLRVGGAFSSRMEAKDGSIGFDFGGTYADVKEHELIAYTMDDGRTVTVHFAPEGDDSKVTVTFDAEGENSLEMQRGGWQAILDNYKKCVEAQG